MPELPEVETTLRGIEPFILNKKISCIEVRKSKLRWPIPSKILEKNLLKESFTSIHRRGKYLILKSKNGYLLIHLGMSGYLKALDYETHIQKHDHFDIKFEDNSLLRFNDQRRFGSILWTKSPESHPLLINLGPEPLGNNFSGEYLHQASRKRQVNIKNFIMNSKIVVGVGNIYANEALFISKIKPMKKAGTINLSMYQDLANSIKTILRQAIDDGGTTLKDFRGADNKPGYFKQHLQVYGRGGEKCLTCNSILKDIRLSNRSSVYCAKCQK